MAGNDTVQRVLHGVQERIDAGEIYRFWYGWMDPDDVGHMAPPWMSYGGSNCTSLFNGIFGEMRDEGYPVAPIGGTGYWNSAVGMGSWEFYEKPNIDKNYPPGCFGVTPYISDDQQGHVQMVATGAVILGPASWGDQTMAQSDHSKGVNSDVSYGWPGPNMDYTMAWTWNNIDWPTWIGLVDGVPVLDGFPGYTASAKEIAKWCGDQMEFFGLPRQLFVQASIPEVTSIWVENRQYEDISDIPGMTYNVDYDSFGPVQQRFQYYPFPWNFEMAVWSFAQVALSMSPAPMPTDADGCAEWIADIQKPAEQYRGRYRRLDDGTDTYAWAMQLVGDSGIPPGIPPGRDYWIGFTADREQWMRGVDVPNNAWIKPTQSGGKVWLEFVPPGTTPAGNEYQTYGWEGFTADREQWMRGVDVPNNAWIRPTQSGGKVWLELVPPA
jgi:hypothetical protein